MINDMCQINNKLKSLKVAKWMKDEWRTMNFEGWMMKDDDFKLLRGFCDWQTDEQTDICECRVAFATEKFPSTGVLTLHVLKQFHALGSNCFFSKQDWSDAYKHIIVRTGDLRLKCVGFLGKIFCKGSLTFGASSSLSIFDCQKYRGY